LIIHAIAADARHRDMSDIGGALAGAVAFSG